MTKIKGLLFDLDGVLVDTAKYHYLAWKQLADKLGIPFTPKDNERLKGVSRMRSFEIILEIGRKEMTQAEKEKLCTEKNEIYLSYINKLKADELLPGVKEFLINARSCGYKTALGSASKNSALILEKLQIKDLLDEVVDGTVISTAKPDPEVFLKGAQLLGLSPKECVVFEDAAAGIEAAHRGGMKAIGIGSFELLPTADINVPDLDGVTAEELIQQLESKDKTYKYYTYTDLTDSGPYVTKLILELPQEVCANAASPDCFSVFVKRRNRRTGEIIKTSVNAFSPESLKAAGDGLSQGWRVIKSVYPCDEQGSPKSKSTLIALEMTWGPLEPLSLCSAPKNAMQNDFVHMDIRVTQTKPIIGVEKCTGLVYETCGGDICPKAAGWKFSEDLTDEESLRYAWFEPKQVGTLKQPLFIWLHGAGGGGEDPRYPIMGNRATSFSSPESQKKLGFPWVYVPQCPTVWMDDGKGAQLMVNNDSMYIEMLKRSIDTFILNHKNSIDTNRIYVAGASNGGYMAVMQALSYPEFYAAAVPVCEAVITDMLTGEDIIALSKVPTWFVHTKNDFVVPPEKTVVPLYKRLKSVGAPVHFTYLDRVCDETGAFKNEDGTPYSYIPHFAWVPTYNDACKLDYDGSPVVIDGQAVTLMEWVGRQEKQ